MAPDNTTFEAPDDQPDAGVAEEPDVSEPDESSTGLAGREAVTLARARKLGVTDELMASIAADADDEQRKSAASANRRGLKHHRKLDLEAAVQAYEAGLGSWPGHVFSRYNLACAKALQGRSREALLHLATLTLTRTEAAGARLRAARTDADFESIRSDTMFRALTSFVPVEVSWSPGIRDTAAVVTLVDALRRSDIPAHEGREWRKDLPATTLYVAINDVVAQSMADEIEATASVLLKRVSSRFLSVANPVVLVLGTDDSVATRSVGAATSVTELLDLPLVAAHSGVQEQLQLKKTGFFTWAVVHPDGRRLTRSGRYTLQSGSLHLDFRLTTEVPGDPPNVTVEQGRRETHEIRIDTGDLLVGTVRFKRAP